MSNLLFLYSNLLDSATLTPSSEAVGFPAANLKNPHRTKTWRTAGAIAGVAQLVIDHGSAKAVNCIALTGYDWLTAPGKLVMEFNDTNVWTSPAATENLTWVSGTTPGGNKGTILLKLSTTRTYRYNRLRVASASGVTLTAAASGSGGITVADNANINFGTGNFALVWKGSLPDWSTSNGFLIDKSNYGVDYAGFYVFTETSTVGIWIGNAALSGEVTFQSANITFSGSTAHEIVIVVTRETPSVAGTVAFYCDGVLSQSDVISAGQLGTLSNAKELFIMGHNTARTAGTVHHAYTLNFAPTASEILDMYRNGIPESWKWGSQTSLNVNTVVSAIMPYTTSTLTSNSAFAVTSNGSATHAVTTPDEVVVIAGKKYVADFTCTLNSGTIPYFDIWTDVSGSSSIMASSSSQIVNGRNQIVATIAISGTCCPAFYNVSTATNYAVTGFTFHEIGATLALEEEGIQIANWQDSSTNNLDATYPISGCTPNAPGDWDLGRLFVGECFEPDRTYGWGYSESVVDPSLISQTIGGQDHADEIERYRVVSVNGIILTQAQWVLYQAMINAVGTRKPIFAAFDYAGEPIERTIYGKFSQVPAITRPYLFEYGFEFTESR